MSEKISKREKSMIKYKEFLSLTDEEIIYIIKEIFPYTKRVDNIERHNKQNSISCNIYIMDEYPDFPDKLELYLPEDESESIQTNDFGLAPEELLKWEQYLLAKGCDYRLKDNPYLEK